MYARALVSDRLSRGNSSRRQLFSEFNFVHNKLPKMNDVYKPHGFIEIQPLIPRSAGHEAVRALLDLCQKKGWQSLLCGIKRHSPDQYMLSYADDGYSIGIDVALRGRTKSDIVTLRPRGRRRLLALASRRALRTIKGLGAAVRDARHSQAAQAAPPHDAAALQLAAPVADGRPVIRLLESCFCIASAASGWGPDSPEGLLIATVTNGVMTLSSNS